MKRWLLSGIVIVGGAMVIACGDQRPDAPAGPVASVTALTTLPVCDLSGTSSLVAQYFNVTDAKTVRDLIDQIVAAGEGSDIARDSGFSIIAIIARNAEKGTGGDASKASDLINKITPCMFRTLEALPETDQVDYTVAIATAEPGGLGVRGGEADPDTAVVSRGGFSGVAPQPGATWDETLNGNSARVAFFGRPGLSHLSYDWKVLPRDATFSPPVVVGLCVNPDDFPITMLHEEHRGLLAFAEADFLDTGTCRVASSRSAFSTITSQFAQLFLPERLSAAAITRGIGGSSGGIGSEFSPNEVPNVSLAFEDGPPMSVTVGHPFRVVVSATDPLRATDLTGAAVPGTSISIAALNNNGVRKTLRGTTTRTTDSTGLAIFDDLRFDPDSASTGGFRLVVGGNVVDRDSIKVGLATSTKVNVKPARK